MYTQLASKGLNLSGRDLYSKDNLFSIQHFKGKSEYGKVGLSSTQVQDL